LDALAEGESLIEKRLARARDQILQRCQSPPRLVLHPCHRDLPSALLASEAVRKTAPSYSAPPMLSPTDGTATATRQTPRASLDGPSAESMRAMDAALRARASRNCNSRASFSAGFLAPGGQRAEKSHHPPYAVTEILDRHPLVDAVDCLLV